MTSSCVPAIPLNPRFPAPGTIYTDNEDLWSIEADDDSGILLETVGAIIDSSGREISAHWKFEYVSTEWLARTAEVEIP